MGTVVDDAASVEFHAFFERHYAELSRLAHLLTGESDAADDLAADALLALWHRWDRVRAADHPAAYARGVVANLDERAKLQVFDDADHSFHVRAKSGLSDSAVRQAMIEETVAWMRGIALRETE